MLDAIQPGNSVSIVHSIAMFMQTFNKSSEHKTVLSTVFSQAPLLLTNGGAVSYTQVVVFMFNNFRSECLEFQPQFFHAIHHILMTDHPRAVRDIYQLYATFGDVTWEMEDSILLRHLAIPTVCYALLSYLIRSYTPSTQIFIVPIIKLTVKLPTLAGLLLCRIISKNPHFAQDFVYDKMQYLQNLNVLVAGRLLFFVGSSQTILASLAPYRIVYKVLMTLVSKNPETLKGVATLIGRFPRVKAMRLMLINSGLLQAVDKVAFKNPEDLEGGVAVVEIHSVFDRFGLPNDYEAVIQWMQERMWSLAAFSRFAIMALSFLSKHEEAKKVMIEKNVVATVRDGDTTEYQEYVEVILKNCGAE
jgi:hypothetical protein